MKIRIVPVAAGLAAAAGLAVTGAFLATAEATTPPQRSPRHTVRHGRARQGREGEGGGQASPTATATPTPPCRRATTRSC